MRWIANNWVTLVTLLISAGTLGTLIYEKKINNKQLEIDRKISVIVDEQRKIQRELFYHVTALLDIDRKITSGTATRAEFREAIGRVQNHQVNIWINLNLNNKHQFDLRTECNRMATALEKYFEDYIEGRGSKALIEYKTKSRYLKVKIWSLIEHYVKEEDRLIQNILEE